MCWHVCHANGHRLREHARHGAISNGLPMNSHFWDAKWVRRRAPRTSDCSVPRPRGVRAPARDVGKAGASWLVLALRLTTDELALLRLPSGRRREIPQLEWLSTVFARASGQAPVPSGLRTTPSKHPFHLAPVTTSDEVGGQVAWPGDCGSTKVPASSREGAVARV